jgi:YHS domain-containing protein
MAKDPICGMSVDEKSAKFKSDYKGNTYYFCSQVCKTTFDKNPAKYAGGSSGHSGGGCSCCCC